MFNWIRKGRAARNKNRIKRSAASAVIAVSLAVFAPHIATGQQRAEQKLERGGKVLINHFAGQVTVTGWDRDVIEATATDEGEAEKLQVQVSGDSRRVIISVGRNQRYRGDIDLKVMVPRYAEIESIESQRGDITVSDVEGAVSINTAQGDVSVTKVGPLKLSTRNGDVIVRDVKGNLVARAFSGDVEASDVTGTVDVSSLSGSITVQNAGGDVSVSSTSGEITVRCARGRAELATVSGTIEMAGVGGDVEAQTTSGEAIFRGQIRAGGRYRLKSLSGEAVMYVQTDPPGFTATLTTYSGELETDFPLKLDSPLQGPINRKMIGRYGDGQAQIALDSFSGASRIVKGTAATLRECK